MDTIVERISATTTEIQIPFSPKNIGKIKTHNSCNIKVRMNESFAETPPSFNAVFSAIATAVILIPESMTAVANVLYP